MRKISVQEGANLPFNCEGKTKEEAVYDWLLRFREHLLQNNLANFKDIIPSKKDLSKLLKVSTGTIQNALKYAEDKGFFVSKQCIGTMLNNPEENFEKPLKPVTKKDRALVEIRKYLANNFYEKGEILPSISSLSSKIKTSPNTLRLVINELIQQGVIRKEINNKNTVLILEKEIKETPEKGGISDIRNKTLPKILKDNIKKYLRANFKTGEKIPTNSFFAKMYGVSIRTVNSCFRELALEKFILSRRGNYGSILLEKNEDEKSRAGLKKYNYKWEETYIEIKNYVLKNSDIGDKIPSIKEFAKMFNVSSSTVKKAVFELIKAGILYAQKGKYGGLFVVEMPEKEGSYRWLAISPEYFDI